MTPPCAVCGCTGYIQRAVTYGPHPGLARLVAMGAVQEITVQQCADRILCLLRMEYRMGHHLRGMMGDCFPLYPMPVMHPRARVN